MNAFQHLEWVHPLGVAFKLTYDKPEDWQLNPNERNQATVERIGDYLRAIAQRKPLEEAA